jgi:hypothetical protein
VRATVKASLGGRCSEILLLAQREGSTPMAVVVRKAFLKGHATTAAEDAGSSPLGGHVMGAAVAM